MVRSTTTLVARPGAPAPQRRRPSRARAPRPTYMPDRHARGSSACTVRPRLPAPRPPAAGSGAGLRAIARLSPEMSGKNTGSAQRPRRA